MVEGSHAIGGRPGRIIEREAVGDIIVQLNRIGVQSALINYFNSEGNIIARIERPVAIEGQVEGEVKEGRSLNMDECNIVVIFIGSSQRSVHRASAIACDGIIRLGVGSAAGIIERQAIRGRIQVVQAEAISSVEDLCPVDDGIAGERGLDTEGNIQSQGIAGANIRQWPPGKGHAIFIKPGAVIFQLHCIEGVIIYKGQEVGGHHSLIVYGNGVVDNISGSEGRGSQFLVELHAQGQVEPCGNKAGVQGWIYLSFVSGGKKDIRQPVRDNAGHICGEVIRTGIRIIHKRVGANADMLGGRNVQLIIEAEETILRIIGIAAKDDEVSSVGKELAIGQPGFTSHSRAGEVIAPFGVRLRSGDQGSRFVVQSYRQVGQRRLAGFLYAVAIFIFPHQVADLQRRRAADTKIDVTQPDLLSCGVVRAIRARSQADHHGIYLLQKTQREVAVGRGPIGQNTIAGIFIGGKNAYNAAQHAGARGNIGKPQLHLLAIEKAVNTDPVLECQAGQALSIALIDIENGKTELAYRLAKGNTIVHVLIRSSSIHSNSPETTLSTLRRKIVVDCKSRTGSNSKGVILANIQLHTFHGVGRRVVAVICKSQPVEYPDTIG